jgi:hypothetical protein
MKPTLKLPVSKERKESRRHKSKLSKEDSLGKPNNKDSKLRKKQDITNGLPNKRESDSRLKGPLRPDLLRRRLNNKLGSKSKNVSDSRDRLHLNKLDSKEKLVRKRPELDLKLNALKERHNSNNGELRENRNLRPEGLSKRDSVKKPSKELNKKDLPGSKESEYSLLRPKLVVLRRRRELLPLEPNGNKKLPRPELLLS